MRYIPLVILFLIIVGFGVVLMKPARVEDSVRLTTLPSIQLADLLDVNARFSSEEWRGKTVLLNVFASWCLPCKVEHPFLMELAKEKRVAIYGLAWKDQPSAIKRMLADGNPYVQTALDESGEYGVALGISGVPESFLIGPQGEILVHYAGPLTRAVWEEYFVPRIGETR